MDIEVYQADAFEIPADVLVLPYAQVLHGLAKLAVEQIEVAAADIRNNLPIEGASLLVDTRGQMAARRVLFVGVVEFQAFGYEAIRQYANVLWRRWLQRPQQCLTSRSLFTVPGTV